MKVTNAIIMFEIIFPKIEIKIKELFIPKSDMYYFLNNL